MRPLPAFSRSAALALVALVALTLAACSFTFDSEVPDVVLRGDPPPPGTFPRLNRKPARDVNVVLDPQGAPYAVIDETPQPSGPTLGLPSATPPRLSLRVVDLSLTNSQEADEEVLDARQGFVSERSILLFDRPADDKTAPTEFQSREPCRGCRTVRRQLPAGDVLLLLSPSAVAVLLAVNGTSGLSAQLFHTTLGVWRDVQLPTGADPKRPLADVYVAFSADGQWLFTRDRDGRTRAFDATRALPADSAKELGILSGEPQEDPRDPVLWLCLPQGVFVVGLDGQKVQRDAAPCDPTLTTFTDASFVYRSDKTLRALPLAGGPARTLRDDPQLAQVLTIKALDGAERVVYSTDPAARFGVGIGDGWLDGVRFMDRGRLPRFSADGARLRWLEHAATSDGVGELRMAPRAAIDSAKQRGAQSIDAPLRLALNVRQYTEIAPGKLLAIANAAYRGPQNRLILIDEDRREARWVVDSARSYTLVPLPAELLVRAVNDANFDILRVPLP